MSETHFIDCKLEETGGFGRYQWLHTTLISTFTRIAYLWQTTIIVFIGYYNDHHCTIPENKTKDEWIPQIIGPDGELMYDQCHHYSNTALNETIACDSGWTYDPETFHPTHGSIVMEWNLVCSRSHFLDISIMCQHIGGLIGTFIGGLLGDRYGRRLSFFLFMALLAVSGITTAFSPSITVFCILSFVTGISSGAIITEGIVLSLEIVPKRVLRIVGPLGAMTSQIAHLLLAFLSFFINHWRYLQLTASVINSVFLFYFWWCPESLHWLYEKDRKVELDKALADIARFNQSANLPSAENRAAERRKIGSKSSVICFVIRKAGEEHHKSQKCSKFPQNNQKFKSVGINRNDSRSPENNLEPAFSKGSNVLRALGNFLKRPRLALYLVISCYLALVVYSAVHGFVYMQGSLTGSIQLNVALNAVMGAIGNSVAMVLSRRFGRRPSAALSFTFFGLAMFLSAASEYVSSIDGALMASVFARAAKVGHASASSIFNFFCLEFVPTNIRSTAVGLQATSGYMGTIVSPFISLSLRRVAFWIPSAVYGTLALLAAALTLFLPETRGRNLPKTAEEVESWPRSLGAADKLCLKGKSKKALQIQQVHDNAATAYDNEYPSVLRVTTPAKQLMNDKHGIELSTRL